MRILVVLLFLAGCTGEGKLSGHNYMQGCKDDKRLEINCIGRGNYYDCRDSWGRIWQQKEELVYDDIFDSGPPCGDNKSEDFWEPTIRTTPYDHLKNRGRDE